VHLDDEGWSYSATSYLPMGPLHGTFYLSYLIARQRGDDDLTCRASIEHGEVKVGHSPPWLETTITVVGTGVLTNLTWAATTRVFSAVSQRIRRRSETDRAAVCSAARNSINEVFVDVQLASNIEPVAETYSSDGWEVQFQHAGWRYTATLVQGGERPVIRVGRTRHDKGDDA